MGFVVFAQRFFLPFLQAPAQYPCVEPQSVSCGSVSVKKNRERWRAEKE